MNSVIDTIIFEDRLKEMFLLLPDMSYETGGTKFPVTFGYGDRKELNFFLKSKTRGDAPYPLIWLLYPYVENHEGNKLHVDGANLVLAVKTIASMQNPERLETTFKKVLIPLFDNIRHLFNVANIVNKADKYEIIKYPNYDYNNGGAEHPGTLIWDALDVKFDISILSNRVCLKPVKFR